MIPRAEQRGPSWPLPSLPYLQTFITVACFLSLFFLKYIISKTHLSVESQNKWYGSECLTVQVLEQVLKKKKSTGHLLKVGEDLGILRWSSD